MRVVEYIKHLLFSVVHELFQYLYAHYSFLLFRFRVAILGELISLNASSDRLSICALFAL